VITWPDPVDASSAMAIIGAGPPANRGELNAD
jgi:hypothetical protein